MDYIISDNRPFLPSQYNTWNDNHQLYPSADQGSRNGYQEVFTDVIEDCIARHKTDFQMVVKNIFPIGYLFQKGINKQKL